MAIKKSELYSSLWASCDELRGSMDASQYKDYVLVLLFMKYVSDKKDPLVELKEGTTFYDMLKYRGKAEIGDKINTIIGEFAKNNGLTGIITEADFEDNAKLGSGKDKIDLLTNLLNIFNKPELDFSKNRADGDDLLGDAYEYLMRHFATESGKSKGQFYTPSEVSRIMAKVIGINKSTSQSQSLYDPTSGSGSLLLKAADEAPHGITIYGQENDNATRALAVMNMWLHNFSDADIKQGNTMATPEFKNEETGELKQFDYAVANPPFSYKKWMNGLDPKNDIYKRFEGYDAIPPKKNGDYAFLLHLIKSLKSKGKACIVLPLGVLFRGNAEAEIRKKIIKKGYIKAIVGLPPNLFYGTGIAASLIIIDKEDADKRDSIFMIDASKGFIKDGNKNRLREQDIHKIVDTFNNQLKTPKFSRLIPITEIADPKNDYNLNIPRYIDSQEEEDIQDIEAHLLGGIPKRDIEALENYWEVYPTLKSTLYKTIDKRPDFYELNIANEEIKNTIFNHPEFTAFGKKMDEVFTKWKNETIAYTKALDKGLRPKHEIHIISENLLKHYDNKQLTDKYAMYQHMMDYWAPANDEEAMQDDFYEIAADGWEAGKEVKYKEKKKKKGDEEITVTLTGIDGLEGRLIPPHLIIQEYFPTEKKEIEDLETKVESAVNEKIELQEEHGGEEAALQGVSTKKEAEIALTEYSIQAMEEYYSSDFKTYSKCEQEAAKYIAFFKREYSNPYIEALKNAKGKITQKALTDKLKITTDIDEKKVIETFVETLKKNTKAAKEMNDLVDAVMKKLETNLKATPETDFIKEIIIIQKYISLLEAEAENKAKLKKALEELEKKVILQYPKLTIEEIKTLVVEKKWIANMEQRIRTEMDNISHRLTQRIKELADRYETPMPKLALSLNDLTSKVEGHLKQMNFKW
jgi:type I restriction enzyme M protein